MVRYIKYSELLTGEHWAAVALKITVESNCTNQVLYCILPGTTITLLNCTVQLPSPPDRVVTITSPLPGSA